MQHAIAENKRNTAIIMAVFVGIIGAIGWIIASINGSPSLMYGIIGMALIYTFAQYFFADKLALMTTGAKPITQDDNLRLYTMVAELAKQTKMPMPKVYMIDDPAPNAFATGRDPSHAVVAATTGIMEVMDDRQLKAVLAHEMGHVRNYDIRVMMIAFGLVSIIGILSDFALRMFIWGQDSEDNVNPLTLVVGAVLLIAAPFIAMIIQFAVSRQREYLADATGAETTHDAEGLAQALQKLLEFGRPMQRQSSTTAHLFISNPLNAGFVAKLFSTHPPLEQRIARLRGEVR